MFPFLPFDPAAITAELDAITSLQHFPKFRLFWSPVEPMTSQAFAAKILNGTSMLPIPSILLRAALRTYNMTNVTSCSGPFAPTALCFLWAAFLAARLLCRFFRACAFRRSLNSRFLPGLLCWFFRRVGCDKSTKPGPLFCPLSCSLTCDLRTILSSAAVSQLCFRRHGCRGRIIALLGFTTGRMLLTRLYCQH